LSATVFHEVGKVTESFEVVARIAVLVFVVTCMVTAGLSLRVRDVVAPLRRARLVAGALVASFIVAPVVAFALAALFALERPHATGLILLGLAAGAPFLPKLAELARGDVAFSVALMLLLTVGSAVILPVALPLLVPGLSAEPWPILRPLLVTMLLPLSIGMVVRGQSETWARRLQRPIALFSNVSLLVAVALLIGLNYQAMIDTIGSGALVAALLFVFAIFAVGYALGGPSPATRSVLGLGTGQRNIAAALVVATGNSDDPQVVIMLLVSTLVGLVVLMPAARLLARHRSASARERNHTTEHQLSQGSTR
jgi:BASS family bile acid:Na+ symporter